MGCVCAEVAVRSKVRWLLGESGKGERWGGLLFGLDALVAAAIHRARDRVGNSRALISCAARPPSLPHALACTCPSLGPRMWRVRQGVHLLAMH